MNREQIIKALECCTSGHSVSACMSGCPLYEKEDCECIYDDTALLKYALSLIREMEIELEAMRTAANSLKMQYEKLTEENERLKELGTTKEIEKGIVRRKTKTDTVRKMRERLKSCFEDDVKYDGFRIVIWIDRIAKEILEGQGTPPDNCASCGAVIPEGRQVCPNCYATEKSKNKKGR